MSFSKQYKLVNNIGGWVVFAIALTTYWLTLEPTASYWDCGEFIIQADKLEVGHPPGNPIFMLTARFFANFASSPQTVSVMVNAMSGLLSALTILLLFWTISHLVYRLLEGSAAKVAANAVKANCPGVSAGRDGASAQTASTSDKGNPDSEQVSGVKLPLWKYIVIMGSALAGSLAYTWSDTFWFSAVEGEVYAFSSFCTALVFWLILKWENRADNPASDRYLILIAYIIGVSIAVHLLNLLCIPAIVLVFCYRKWKDMNLVKSLIALLVSFVIVFLVLYGLVPGFIGVAQRFELFFVNTLGCGFNSGALAYALATLVVFGGAIACMRIKGDGIPSRVLFLLAVTISGMLFFCEAAWLGWLFTAVAAGFLFSKYGKKLSIRVMEVMMWSIAVIFVGYSSYALILIRSTAATPMNQNAPDNVFDLASYLNREQYGETPLLYGPTLYSAPVRTYHGADVDTLGVTEDGMIATLSTPRYGNSVVKAGKPMYGKGVPGATPHSEYNLLTGGEMERNARLADRGGDYYVLRDYKPEVKMNPELNMLFPRLYSRQHASAYANWVQLDTVPGQLVQIMAEDDMTGAKVPELNLNTQPLPNAMSGGYYYPEKRVFKPTFLQNLKYFFNYQLDHMYWRYFMWNFAGRQNDINNQQGELDAGNWISGIPFIDNARLGDQSLLPEDLGNDNPGHNVYFMLPLILGLIGLVWQSLEGKRGIEQFWVVFFLFFMTGIAIVLYLNQTPGQPRERDYAFAGSFYAYAIWIGMGVAGVFKLLELGLKNLDKKYIAGVASLIGLAIPLQMVSQTWDDHDRSGRYAARDFAVNYLESLEPDAIVFCNGDNDTFPLWYAQEVEGVRPDVRIINLSYLNSDWYANQQRLQSYSGAPVHFTATPADIAYGNNDVTVLPYGGNAAPADLLSSLKVLYSGKSVDEMYGYRQLPSAVVTIPIDKKLAVKRGLVAPADTASLVPAITIDLAGTQAYRGKGYLGLGEILMLDIIATNAAEGWPRPIYWCSTVGDEYHVGLTPYLRSTGMTHQLVPTVQEGKVPRTDRILDVINKKYRWGGADTAGKVPYFDETARRMLYTVRNSIVETASQLVYEGDRLEANGDLRGALAKYNQAVEMVDKVYAKTPERVAPMDMALGLTSAQIYCEVAKSTGNEKLKAKGLKILEGMLGKYSRYVAYSMDIQRRFGQASLTYETQLAPYQYFRLIDLYRQYGGSAQFLEKVLARTGLTEETLRKYYDMAYGDGALGAAGQEGGANAGAGDNPDELAAEVGRYCEVANTLASMSPEEYAAASEQERSIDSVLVYMIDLVKGDPAAMGILERNEHYKRLDMARSQRLWKEFQAAHPDLE